jgi:hypothetical protein
MAAAARPRWPLLLKMGVVLAFLVAAPAAEAWTGEIRGRVVCDVCGDAAIGPEDHALEGPSRTPAFSLLVRVYNSLIVEWPTAASSAARLCFSRRADLIS